MRHLHWFPSSWSHRRSSRLGLLLCLALAVSGGLALALPGRAYAATLTVSSCTESALDAAVATANPGDTVQFGCSGTITLTSTLNITKDLTLEGGHQNVTLDGNHSVQVLFVSGGVNLALDHLTVADGFTTNVGGGAYVSGGILSLANCTFVNNTSQGPDGAPASDSSGLGGNGGAGGGGGLYSVGGAVTISDCSFVGNVAQGGAGGAGGTDGSGNGGMGGGGGSGFGGALYGYRSTIAVVNSVFAGNIAQGGIGGNGGSGCSRCTAAAGGPGGGGGFGNGGSIYISRGQLTLANSTVENNSALGAVGGSGASGVNGGNGGDGGPGGFATGGGFSSATGGTTDGFIFSLTGSTVNDNSALGGAGGAGGVGVVGGNGGNGGNATGSGAFSEVDTSGTFSNCTISGNGTQAGSGGSGASGGGSGGNGGNGLGGGLYAANGSSAITTLTNCTLASNSAQGANGGVGGNAGSAGGQNVYYGAGGILPGTIDLANSIVSGSAGDNCGGSVASIVDDGYNLDSGTSCGFSAANHSLSNTDPKLAPLADNGGPAQTMTMALLAGSPAIDAGGTSANGCPPTDQRQAPRPQGPACDIGAYEFGPAMPPGPPLHPASATITTRPTASPNPGWLDQPVRLCAIVAPSTGSQSLPGGSVRFQDGATMLGMASLNTSDTACFTTNRLAVGTHNITVSYAGDASFSPSTSAALVLTIRASGQDAKGSSAGTGSSGATNGTGAATNSRQAHVASQQNPAVMTVRAASASRRTPTSARQADLGMGVRILLGLVGLLGLGGLGTVLYRARYPRG